MGLPIFYEANRPFSPEREGVIVGMTTKQEYGNMHFDGADHPLYKVELIGVDPCLADRDDFIEGVGKGMALRRDVESRGFVVLEQESREELLARSYGGTD